MKKRRTPFIASHQVKRQRYLVDAAGQVLGRLATKVAVTLRGKHKPIFTPQSDCGDFIVIVNADKIKVTGKKLKGKMYFTHSGYPGGDKMISLEKMLATRPEKVIRLAIAGMLPHNRLGAQLIKKLSIYKGQPAQLNKLQKLEV
jgi:large subunit ribosomal protein L13